MKLLNQLFVTSLLIMTGHFASAISCDAQSDEVIRSYQEHKTESCTHMGYCMGIGNSGYNFSNGKWEFGLNPSPGLRSGCKGEIKITVDVVHCKTPSGYEYEVEDESSRSSCN